MTWRNSILPGHIALTDGICWCNESTRRNKISNLVEITEAAAKQIRKIRSDDDVTGAKKLRVSVVGGGCSGFSYRLDFDEPKDTDMVVSGHGVDLLVDPKSAIYITGTKLDYSGGLNGKGFEFINPNATRTCGCGSSFSV